MQQIKERHLFSCEDTASRCRWLEYKNDQTYFINRYELFDFSNMQQKFAFPSPEVEELLFVTWRFKNEGRPFASAMWSLFKSVNFHRVQTSEIPVLLFSRTSSETQEDGGKWEKKESRVQEKSERSMSLIYYTLSTCYVQYVFG